MATYKDDLDILKAAEKADTNKLTFNAITELDNKGLLGRYGGEGEGEESAGIDLGITGASVGEYAKIKTVNADGVPTAWESGNGGGGGDVLVVGIDMQTMTLDKTWNEIYSASLPVIKLSMDGSFHFFHVEQIITSDDYFGVYVTNWDNANSVFTGSVFECNSADGYPVLRGQ